MRKTQKKTPSDTNLKFLAVLYTDMEIPFNKLYYSERSLQFIEDALKREKICGGGFYSKKVEKFIEKQFSTPKALFVTSGTAALDMSALLLDLKEGDEVLMPSYTFVSTANCVVLRRANPVFVDIEPKTLNINLSLIESKITEKTKAIYPVHYGGISCDMKALMKLAKKHNLKVVEDSAQGFNAQFNQKYLGTLVDLGCYSFHETKNYQCGEGGALLINNEDLTERAEIIQEKGTNRKQFMRGLVDKYSWVDIGSSFVGCDLLAAFLWGQILIRDEILQRRKAIFEAYYNQLKELHEKNALTLPHLPKYASPNYHLFYILLKTPKTRDRLMNFLQTKGISAFFHYVPLHNSKMGQQLGYGKGDLPITEDISERLLRLPFFTELTNEQIEYITTNIKGFFKQ